MGLISAEKGVVFSRFCADVFYGRLFIWNPLQSTFCRLDPASHYREKGRVRTMQFSCLEA